jgi:alpha-glucosidase (family GH31 glycosyl hydrolase)
LDISEDEKNNLFDNKIIREEPNFDFRESIGLSFKLHSQYLYGLPERADTFLLHSTENGEPYRLYNLDIFEHKPFDQRNLYGSIPYLTAHSAFFDSSIVWMNSAETFVDIFDNFNL